MTGDCPHPYVFRRSPTLEPPKQLKSEALTPNLLAKLLALLPACFWLIVLYFCYRWVLFRIRLRALSEIGFRKMLEALDEGDPGCVSGCLSMFGLAFIVALDTFVMNRRPVEEDLRKAFEIETKLFNEQLGKGETPDKSDGGDKGADG